jgi:hypothetical protein
MTAAESVLSLLFKKLHPLLEDTAHALATQASRADLERLHLKLIKGRLAVLEVLEPLAAEETDGDLAEALEELISNLTPCGETFQQALVLTQLCLEDAPDTFLPFLPAGVADEAPWNRRLETFLALVQDPAKAAHHRWEAVDPDIGESEEE